MPGALHRGRIFSILKRAEERGKFFNAKKAIEDFRKKLEFNFKKLEEFLENKNKTITAGVNTIYDPIKNEWFYFTSQEYEEMKAIHEKSVETSSST